MFWHNFSTRHWQKWKNRDSGLLFRWIRSVKLCRIQRIL
jgi:hypothetical protein